MAAARAGFDGNVTVLKDRDPAAYARLAPRFAEATAAADAFIALLQKQVVEAPADGGRGRSPSARPRCGTRGRPPSTPTCG